MDLIKIFIYTGYLILALNTFLFFKNYRKNLVAFKLFAIYLALTLIVQLSSRYLSFYKLNNLHLSHYYFIGQFLLLSLFFKTVLEKKVLKKAISIILISVLIALSIYYVINPSHYNRFNIFEILITSVPLIVYCFFFFIQTIDGTNKKFIYIISGLFLYILCSTLLFTAGNLDNDTRDVIWWSNTILYLVYQVLIFIEWYKHLRKNSDKTILQVPKT
jgi:hypothetical protein